MKEKNKFGFLSFLFVVFMILPVIWQCRITAQIKNPNPARFLKKIEDFRKYDKKNWFPDNSLLFIGSSSTEIWDLHFAFPKLKVVNRGLGGSHISDINFFINDVVLKYHPKMIVFYAGDNDIYYNKSSEQVFKDFKKFTQTINDSLEETTTIFISIKPSLKRWNNWPEMVKVNNIIGKYCKTNPKLFYLDISKSMIDETGRPMKELFRNDSLHLNDNGYSLWNKLLRPILYFDLLHSMAIFDKQYIPVLAFTSQDKYIESINAFKSLKLNWKNFNKKFSKYFFDDPEWICDFNSIEKVVNNAEKLLNDKETKESHVSLEQIRLIFMKLRERNKLPYFIDLLTKFHEPMEKMLLSAISDEKVDIPPEKWNEYNHLAGKLISLWSPVEIDKIDNMIFELDSGKLTKIKTSIENENKLLKNLLAEIKKKDNSELLAIAKKIKQNFASIFKSFGDFNHFETK